MVRLAQFFGDFLIAKTLEGVGEHQLLGWIEAWQKLLEKVAGADGTENFVFGYEAGCACLRVLVLLGAEFLCQMVVLKRVQAATSAQIVKQMEVAALEVPAWRLTRVILLLMPKVEQGLLLQVLAEIGVGADTMNQFRELGANGRVSDEG